MKADYITKLLLAIATFLGTLAVRPLVHPDRVRAETAEGYPFFVEPGYTTIRKPDGSAQVYGKVMIDMRTGDVWGFPTLVQAPYPVSPNAANTKGARSEPIYLKGNSHWRQQNGRPRVTLVMRSVTSCYLLFHSAWVHSAGYNATIPPNAMPTRPVSETADLVTALTFVIR
jgi:hypothetical protein